MRYSRRARWSRADQNSARRFRAENVTTASIFQACKHSFDCDRTIDSWQRYSLPDIQELAAEWKQREPPALSDATLMDGMRKLAVEDAGTKFGLKF